MFPFKFVWIASHPRSIPSIQYDKGALWGASRFRKILFPASSETTGGQQSNCIDMACGIIDKGIFLI